jgi:phospholysine phosphohistidine inorganic pyrophosphate phosphatase
VTKSKFKGLLIDLEGVVYEEGKPILGSVEFIQFLNKINFPYLFLTNTTTMPRKHIQKRLQGLGVSVDEKKILTPLIACNNYLLQKKVKRIALFCDQSCYKDFQNFQLDFQNPEAVIIGDLYKKFTWSKINEIFLLSLRAKHLLAFHKNKTGKRNNQFGIDLGPFVAGLEYALDRKFELLGKPSKNFFKAGMSLLKISSTQLLMVGDDVVVDILGAQKMQLQTCLVKTGKYNKQNLNGRIKPDILINRLSLLKKSL